MIDVLLPGKHFIHNFPGPVDIVRLEVELSERFNIVLSLFDEKSVPGLGIGFELVDGLVDFDFEIVADPFDELIEFDEVIVLPELLLDFVVLGPGGPVVHFPEFSLF